MIKAKTLTIDGTEYTVSDNPTRYLSLEMNGDEWYIENIPTIDKLEGWVDFAKHKLQRVRELLPNAEWSIVIVDHLHLRYSGCLYNYYKQLNIETGKIEESIVV